MAWVLNSYPEARNSDITLQLRYWETFCPDEYDGVSIAPDDLYHLPRLTSLVRARARVQNTLKLFLADPSVRERRGTLSDDERQEAAAASLESAPVYVVYADESGKTARTLIVGSLWLLQGPETFRITGKLHQWRDAAKWKDELHFTELDDKRLPYYKQAIDIVLNEAAAISLKYIAVERAGAGRVQDVIPKLLYHLLVQGVTHENASGRAPLPRNLVVWKDAEEAGYDRVVLADVRDRLKTAAAAQFGGRLAVETVEAADSKGNDLLQVADLFAASLNRLLNPPDPPPRTPGSKDELARYVLERTGVSLHAESADQADDLAVRINL